MSFATLKEITDNITIPVVAIGGINHNNILELKGSGIDGVAVISALFAQKNTGKATRDLLNLCEEVINAIHI